MIIGKDRVGYWLAILTAGLTAISFSLAMFGTPSYTYPYPYTPPFIIGDFLWLVPAFVLMPTFVALTAFLHHRAPNEKKVFTQIALTFAIICAAVMMADFFIQWTVVLPSTLKGETEGLQLFTQYNPHGLFVALESLAYLMMSSAFLFLTPLFGGSRSQRTIRWLFTASFVLAVGGFTGLTLAGYDVVQFEVIVITVNWTILIITGILLARLFKRGAPDSPESH